MKTTSRRWLIALSAVAAAGLITVGTVGAYILKNDGNRPLAAGLHTVSVYTIDDSISTVVPPSQRPGVIGRFFGMCDGDTYYMQVGGTGMCIVLDGSLGTVHVDSTGHGVQLPADQAAAVRTIIRRSGTSTPPTRVVLGYDGGWAGILDVTTLNTAGPVTAQLIG